MLTLMRLTDERIERRKRIFVLTLLMFAALC